MARGSKMSVYFSDNNLRLLNNMSEDLDVPKSEVIGRAIYNQAILTRQKLSISEGAYLCIAAGRFDLLRSFKLDDGGTIVTMAEDGYRNPDGSPGEFAEAKDVLRTYLLHKME